MYYPDEVIEEVRSRNDIVDVISSYVKLKRQGNSYFGLCPFHNEKSPSFSVSPGKQMYYCFGCGAGGNVMTFVMQYENYSFQEAMQMLAERAGITLPEQEYTPEQKKQRDLKSQILQLNKEAAAFYYYQLRSPSGTMGMDYLRGRELTDDTMKSFGLGYAGKYSDQLYKYLKQKGYGDELLAKSGLLSVDEKRGMYDKFWNRVMFPIMDVNNRVIGFGGRVMGDAKPKYLNSPETPVFDKGRNLYALNRARTSRKKFMIVCEGYMDVISMHQAGFTNAVASLGTALTSQHASLLRRYTDNVVLSYDSDGAGIKAGQRAIPLMRQAGITARILNLKPYKDPDEFIKNLGMEAFQERLEQAENAFMWQCSVLEQEYNMADPESKTKFFRKIASMIAAFEQELERENYIEAVAEKYHTGFQALRDMVLDYLRLGIKPEQEPDAATTVPARPVRKNSKANKIEAADMMSQRLLLTWLTEYSNFYPLLKEYVQPEDFDEGVYRETAQLMYEQLENGRVNPAQIISHFADPEDQKTAASLFNTAVKTETSQDTVKAIRETIMKVMDHSMKAGLSRDINDASSLQKMVEKKKKAQKVRQLQFTPILWQ